MDNKKYFLLLPICMIMVYPVFGDSYNRDNPNCYRCSVLVENEYVTLQIYNQQLEINEHVNIYYSIDKNVKIPWIFHEVSSPTGGISYVGLERINDYDDIYGEFDFYVDTAGNYTLKSITPTFDVLVATINIPHPQYCGNDISYYDGNIIHGTDTSDYLIGDSHNNLIFGYEGNDFINGKGGVDCIVSGTGFDIILEWADKRDILFYLPNTNDEDLYVNPQFNYTEIIYSQN